jgi:hypothetical protein
MKTGRMERPALGRAKRPMTLHQRDWTRQSACTEGTERVQHGALDEFEGSRGLALEPFGWNYKSAEKYCWLIFL